MALSEYGLIQSGDLSIHFVIGHFSSSELSKKSVFEFATFDESS